MTKIATRQTFDEGADVIVREWEKAGRPKVIRLEGFDGVGKSGLAKLIVDQVNGIIIEGDKYAVRPEFESPYWRCLRLSDLEQAISAAVQSGKVVVLDAVCLDEVAPIAKWSRGFVVYVKRLSFNNRDPMWHEGLHLEDESPDDQPRRSIVEYHKRTTPHLSADLIVELPSDTHRITPGEHERHWCFDPPGAEVI